MSGTTQQIRFMTDQSGANTPYDMYLAVFGMEIITAYERARVFADKVRNETIDKGFDLEFPEYWKIGSMRHEAGTMLIGEQVESNKRVISLDKRPLVSSFGVDDIDVMTAHFDVRGEFARQVGIELAQQDDLRTAMLLTLAARDSGNGSHPGGNQITKTNTGGTATATGAGEILDAIDEQCIYWDENDVPREQRWCAVKWGLWHQLRKLDSVITAQIGSGMTPTFGNRDFDPSNPSIIGATSYPEALWYNGAMIVGTNNLPSGQVITAADQFEDNYVGDYSNTTGLIWQQDAVGHLQKLGLTVETERSVRIGEDFFVGKILTGGGTLRPVAACEILDSGGA